VAASSSTIAPIADFWDDSISELSCESTSCSAFQKLRHAATHLEKLIFEGDNDMSNSWDDRRRALEEEYIERQNKAALESLARKSESHLAESPLKSPVSGKPMTREQILGVTIDRCTESGGIWLDKGELEALLDRASQGDTIDKNANQSATVNWLQQFWLRVTGK
jgi:Zn-finger nucleic acid-binding protein